MTSSPEKNKISRWARTSITARMLMVGFLILILMIPLSYTDELIRDRKQRQKEVISSINEQWGKEILLYGPILQVPYKSYTETIVMHDKKKRTELTEDIEYMYFFPSLLNIESVALPEVKKRGLYETAVYDAQMQLSGTFNLAEQQEQMYIDPEEILWNKACVLLQTSNLKGVHKSLSMQIGQEQLALKAQYHKQQTEHAYYDETDPINLFEVNSRPFSLLQRRNDSVLSFQLDMQVYGSEQLRFVPIGKETFAHIRSDWHTANFIGEYLPYNPDKITNDGFDAKWKVLEINRAFSQQFIGQLPDLQSYAFGVNFMIPIDEYQKSERTGKYGFLVIALTFLIFFLIQTGSKIEIHPFQYLMVGIALVLFYTLLVAISEYSSFHLGYIIASIAVIALISLYSISIFRNRQHPTLIALSLSALYAFIFAIIQMESYALLVGSIGMFIILAAVMYFSRKIEW